MTLRQKLALARKRYIRSHSDRALKSYLMLKSKAGIWDSRYLRYYGIPSIANKACRKFIMRGYAAGLVVTATTNGRHAPGSYHYQKRAVDLGLRRGEIGTAYGRHKMEKFQRSEFSKRGRYHHRELIGPINNRIILMGRATVLAEGAALENAHDNHVHGAF